MRTIVGNNLRTLREASGASVTDFAQAFGVHRQVWYRWEQGKARPRRSYWPMLETAFSKPIQDIIGFTL